jgi:hypothetical protein
MSCEAHRQDIPAGMPGEADPEAYLCELAARGTTTLDSRACAHAAARWRGPVGRWLAAAALDCDCVEQAASLGGLTAACR